MYQHILIATDGSNLSQKAIEYGLGLSKHSRMQGDHYYGNKAAS